MVLKVLENIKSLKLITDVQNVHLLVNYYKLMVHLISFSMEIIRNIVCMDLLTMLHIK